MCSAIAKIPPMATKPRILVVEDEPSVAENIDYALRTENFSSQLCGTGAECMAALGAGQFDLVILDVGLPDANGFDLCRQIRNASNVPIMFLTARADEIDRVVGLEIGADDYLVKPFSPRELTARVRAILRRVSASTGQKAEEVALPGLPFSIDRDRFRISYHGTALNLTKYEFRILDIFLSHPGRIYSRERLMSVAWDEPESSMERTVDAHIKSIRGKLEAVKAGEEPIITHRGLGYSLREEW